jgi:hypothetical protein
MDRDLVRRTESLVAHQGAPSRRRPGHPAPRGRAGAGLPREPAGPGEWPPGTPDPLVTVAIMGPYGDPSLRAGGAVDKEEVVAFVKARIGRVKAPRQIELRASLSNFSI